MTEANVRSIDLANGGADRRRLAGRSPHFRPVAQYEAGRPQMIADARNRDRQAPRFGGFFRAFFGGDRAFVSRAGVQSSSAMTLPCPSSSGPTRRLATPGDSGPGLSVLGGSIDRAIDDAIVAIVPLRLSRT